MSYDLGLKGKIKSEKMDLTPPDEILKSLCDEIKKETDGEIEGVVLPYSGRMKSYTKKGGMLGYTQDKEVNIQDSLGAVGNKISRFEFCLATPIYKDFRYRIMLIEYDLAVYPATVVLEEDISDQLQEITGYDYEVECNSREEFENLAIAAIRTRKVRQMMLQLLKVAENQRRQAAKKKASEDDEL